MKRADMERLTMRPTECSLAVLAHGDDGDVKCLILQGKRQPNYGFTGIIEPASATRIASACNLAVNSGCEEIYLCLSSTGGYIADGVYLYNHITGLPIEVVIHNTGTVASIATAVYAAAGRRYCSQHGIFMIHPTEIPSQEYMRAEKLQSHLDAALADDERTENILRQRASIPDDILAARRFNDVYITLEKAVEFRLAHAVCDFSLPRGYEILQI